jgi:hypothetical protein
MVGKSISIKIRLRRFGMKFRKFISIAIVAAFAYTLLLFTPALAGERRRPNVNKTFSPEKEAKIQALRSLRTKDVFNRLKGSDFMMNRDMTYKAIYNAYANRRAEAVSLAMKSLRSPLVEIVNGQRITHDREFITAKRIFEVFPKESISTIMTFYHRSDAVTRGNILAASGGIDEEEEPAVKEMLVKALDDKSIAEEQTPEMLGEPLRVCDIAYNQLVLRYGITGVLRTISPAHKFEVRDYHIKKLKSLL